MENQQIVLGELFFLELFLGSFVFILGTCFFVFLLWKLKIKLFNIGLFCFFQVIFSLVLSTVFWVLWPFKVDIMQGVIFLPGIFAELVTIPIFYRLIQKNKMVKRRDK